MRDPQQAQQGRVAVHGRAVSCVLALALGAGCATDDLNRLGAGRASIIDGSHPTSNGALGDARLDAGGSEGSPVSDAGPLVVTFDASSPAPNTSELIPNPSFEAGHMDWIGFGESRIIDVADAHSGSRAIMSTNRVATWEGPSFDVRSLVVAGRAYGVSAWVRNEYSTHNIMLTLKTKCGTEIEYTRLATRAVANSWQQLDASFFAPDCTDLAELSIYVEGPPAYKNVLLDDVSLRGLALSESNSDTGD